MVFRVVGDRPNCAKVETVSARTSNANSEIFRQPNESFELPCRHIWQSELPRCLNTTDGEHGVARQKSVEPPLYGIFQDPSTLWCLSLPRTAMFFRTQTYPVVEISILASWRLPLEWKSRRFSGRIHALHTGRFIGKVDKL